MQHAEPDQLALLALGESLENDDAGVTAHLAHCELCRQEVEALRRTVELARETVEYRDEQLDAPPALWHRISGELGLGGSVVADGGSGSEATERPGWVAEHRRRDDDTPSHEVPAGDPDERTDSGHTGRREFATGTGRSGGSAAGMSGPWSPPGGDGADAAWTAPAGGGSTARARRRWARTAGALVAAAAVGVLGTLVAVRPWQDTTVAPPAASSTASLGPVTGGPSGVSGRAVVRQGPAGPELDVTATGLPLQQGYYEVWVFDGDRNMVSVGVLGADSTASLPLPPTLDLRTYHDVDISEERYDGDQTHSLLSVLRGTLTG